MNGSQTRRPRPRARDPNAIENENERSGVKVDGDDLFVKSGSSKLSQSPKKRVDLKRERSPASQSKDDKNAGTTFLDLYRLDDIDAEEDDDEYLFNRTRSRHGPNLLVDPVDLIAPIPSSSPQQIGSQDDDGGGEGGHDSDESDGIQSKRLNPWTRRSKKQYRSQWSRVDSQSTSKQKVKALRLSSDSGMSDGEDTTLTSPIAGHTSVKKADGQAAKVNLLKKRRSRSRSITPPPEVEAKKLLEIEKMIKTVLDRSTTAYERANEHIDEDSVDALLNDDNVMADLDPDLRRAMRGSSAAVLRKQLRERDARNLELQARARRSLSRQTNSTNNTTNGSSNTIEISDSDDETRRRKVPSTSYASRNTTGAPSNALPSKRRNTRNSARARDSSSPVLVSVINGSDRQNSPPRRSQKAPIRPRRESHQNNAAAAADDDDDDDDDGAGSESDNQDDDMDGTEERSQSRTSETQWQTQRGTNEQGQEDDEERIQIVMKGGPMGALQVLVNVRRSTLIEKLLDHFIKVHRDAIPLERTSKVRIRFDGEILKDRDTVADIGIEDEEQMDVVW